MICALGDCIYDEECHIDCWDELLRCMRNNRNIMTVMQCVEGVDGRPNERASDDCECDLMMMI